MTDHRTTQDADEEDAMAQLFDGQTARASLSPELMQKASGQSHAAWQEVVRQRQQRKTRRRWQSISAVAAALLLGLGLFTQLRDQGIAVNVMVAGADSFLLNQAPSAGGLLRLHAQDEIESATALHMVVDETTDMRLAANAKVIWLTPTEVRLEQGTIYIETHNRNKFHVRTAVGLVEDIGTEYQVHVDGVTTEVAVRDGKVSLIAADATHQAEATSDQAGVMQISIDRSGAIAVVQAVEAKSSPRWQWAFDHGIEFQGKPVLTTLEQLSRATGKGLVFARKGLQAQLLSSRIQGSTQGLSVNDVLALVAASENLVIEQTATDIRIGFGSAKD